MRASHSALVVLLLAVPAQAQQVNTVEEIDAVIQAQYQPQWAGGGNSGIRQAMRDWLAHTHPNFVPEPQFEGTHYPQCIFRNELHEIPIIVLGGFMPEKADLPNRDDQADDRVMRCKDIFIATNPATGLDYVEPASLTRGVKFTTNEYLVPESMTPIWDDRNGYWVELCYLWSAADDGIADGMRCATQGEGIVNHNAAWHPVDLP